MIAINVLDYEEAAEDDSIDHDGDTLGEEDGSCLVREVVTEEVEYMQKSMKSSSLSYYRLKPSHLITHGFDNNRTAKEKLFKHMCNFGSREDWMEGIRVVGYYLHFETTKDQCRLLNPAPLTASQVI